MTTKRRVLWVDDDDRDRFLYELSVLEDNDFNCDWALDAEEAMYRLSRNGYDLVLLDQVFPIGRNSSYKDVWSGSRLLYWLRGEQPPAKAPQGPLWVEIQRGKRPLPENMNLPVIIISGFQDDQVDEALREISRDITIFPKPVDGDELIATIDRLLPREL